MKNYNLKQSAAWAALKYVTPGSIVGIGSGTTVSYFISALSTIKNQIEGTVSSSNDSTTKLKSLNIPVFSCNDVESIPIYVDSADEINKHLQLIKGRGGALTQEKVISAVSKKFICIADTTKLVNILGRKNPLPIEVIPMARAYIGREVVKLGGIPKYRTGIITENGNIIIDIYNLCIVNPLEIEAKINMLSGVVTVGLFARRSADIALISTLQGVNVLHNTTKLIEEKN
ncbi:MAG: ribose-5-phosphate isomerase RpiA [Candidatus Dasytiphilus stammeri]